MTTETKAEIVIAAGLALFLGYLWYASRPAQAAQAAAASPGINVFPASSNALPGPTLFQAPAAVPGVSSCGCGAGTGTSGNLQYGSLADLINAMMTPAAADMAPAAAPPSVNALAPHSVIALPAISPVVQPQVVPVVQPPPPVTVIAAAYKTPPKPVVLMTNYYTGGHVTAAENAPPSYY